MAPACESEADDVLSVCGRHTQEDGIGRLARFQSRRGQGLAVFVECAPSEVMRLEFELYVGRLFGDDLEHAGCFRDDFGA